MTKAKRREMIRQAIMDIENANQILSEVAFDLGGANIAFDKRLESEELLDVADRLRALLKRGNLG